MTVDDFHIARLMARHLSGQLSNDERTEFEAWLHADPSNEELWQRIASEQEWESYLRLCASFDKEKGWAQVQRLIRLHRRKRMVRWCAAAAAAILLPLLVIGMLWQEAAPQEDQLARATEVSITPGKAQAILTLENGEQVALGCERDTAWLTQRGVTVRTDSARIVYRGAEQKTEEGRQIAIHRVETPKGGEYSLLLSDGTRVRLNAMSSLRYPERFDGESRVVEMEGEAFFEVSKGERPFIVKSRGMKVEVLGTRFDLSAYENEPWSTTLIEGKVKIHSPKGESCLLHPEQQALLPEGGGLQVRRVDTSIYTDWLKGKISFRDERLEEIMKVLSRWYDMEIAYAEEGLKELRFGCHLNRYDDILPFVKLLEETGKLRIHVEGRKLTFHSGKNSKT